MANGQITLPIDIRKRMGVSAGDRLALVYDNSRVSIVNPADYALELIQVAMAGEWENLGDNSDAETDDYISESRLIEDSGSDSTLNALFDDYLYSVPGGKTRGSKPLYLEPRNVNRENDVIYCGLACTSTEIAVLNYLKDNPRASHVDISQAVGKAVPTTRTTVNSLKIKGLLTREGSQVRGDWVVKQEE
jgi:AbrB family looped-hinge helix DNA binding protein